MAHRTTHRRTLASPDPNPSSMDSNLTKHPKTTTFTAATSHHHPTAKQSKPSFMVNHFSRLNLNHRVRSSQKPTNHPQPTPHLIDTHLQAKAMSASAIFDTSKSSIKPNSQNTKVSSKLEKQSKPTKQIFRDKPKSISELEKKKLYRVIKNELKNGHGELDCKRVCEEVKIEESKNSLEGYEYDTEIGPSFSLALSGGRRRSFGGSQIHAVECARKTFDSMENFTSKTLALTLKKEFDGVYGPAWHCIVGTSFGSFVTHSVGGFLYFSMDQKLYVLLFKTTVQRAE
ncbi:Dynein light chain [Quillaja saponaria]|uniref:Dynein light chain n=1 Tax=Quillaja saponaria TaxID=32244 RepID=A0AAD7LDV0_QUISA|nr:Dynein light chain [Quillaja saponaria]